MMTESIWWPRGGRLQFRPGLRAIGAVGRQENGCSNGLTYESLFVNTGSRRGEYPGFGVTVSSAGSVRPGASAAKGGGGDLRRLA